jgi:uncharacterized protein (TIGR02145 family)
LLIKIIIRILVFSTIGIILFSCKTEPIVLRGKLEGLVTDAETSVPLQAALVKLDPSNDSILTGVDGEYLFKSLEPDYYNLEVSKPAYDKQIKSGKVISASTTYVNFEMVPGPDLKLSDTLLDFGFDSTLKFITISNAGKGTLGYSFLPNQNWISVNPESGEATIETDTILVTIDRTGLSGNKHRESIRIVWYIGEDIQENKVNILVNGVMDQDGNYYGTVIIGAQTWMAENLNTGVQILLQYNPSDNSSIEKWCYDDNIMNCNIYGGLYNWSELMDYNPNDEAEIGTTQGICPVGWHIPTYKEWSLMITYLGDSIAGGKLKETGTVHWNSPNTGSTNETGFTALPGGWKGGDHGVEKYEYIGARAEFWTASSIFGGAPNRATGIELRSDSKSTFGWNTMEAFLYAFSVRCIKDP